MTDHKFIPLSIPNLGGNEWKYIKDCIDTNWVSSVGSYVDQFEENLAEFVTAKHAIATSNGTSALHICLNLIGSQPGDGILVPNLTFVASANSVAYTGATPRFIGVDRNNWQLDTVLLERYLEKDCEMRNGVPVCRSTGVKIKAVMPVHMFGNLCDMDHLKQLADQYKLTIIEDATEALGSTYKGKQAGNLAHLGCFSFNGNKIMTTGGGGMIVTNDTTYAKRAKHLTTQAKTDPFEYLHDEVGYNYRMVNILAAMGVAQLEQLPQFIIRKQEIAQFYMAELSGLSDFEFMQIDDSISSNQWLFTMLSDKQREIFSFCSENKIQVRPIWTPMTSLPMYKDHLYITEQQNSEAIHKRSVSLPCSTGITDGDLQRVVEVVKKLVS